MRLRVPVIGATVVMVLSLAACGDRPQTMDATGKKTDAQAWSVSERANPAYKLPGWKAGDKTSWENELRQRAQAQNDYAR